MAKVKQLTINNEEIYPLTHESAVVDNNGVNLSSKIDQFATEDYVNNKIAEVQLEGGNVDLSGYATKTELSSHTNSTTVHVTASEKSAWNNKSTFSGNYNDLTNKPTIPGCKVAYGTCSTDAATAEKTVVVDDTKWKLEIGNIIVIGFLTTNSASNVKINVNGTGAYPIWSSAAEYTGTSSNYTGYANRTYTYIFNGTHWVWLSNGVYPSSTTQASIGQGYGECTTAEATLAKVCSIGSYSLAVGGIVSIKFTKAVPANSTLNIRSRGAKKIFYRGSAITNGIIKAGDIATFIYDGTQYHLISIDSIVACLFEENQAKVELPNKIDRNTKDYFLDKVKYRFN